MPEFLPDAKPITFTELRRRIRDSNADRYALAWTVLNYSCKKIPLEEYTSSNPVFHVWGAGALALAALGAPPLGAAPDPLRGFSDEKTAQLLVGIAGLTSEDRANAKTQGETDTAVRLNLLRTICTQSSVQGDPHSQIYRTLHLLELINDDGYLESRVSPYDSLFERAYGCRAIEYMELMHAFYAYSGKSGLLDVRAFVSPAESPPYVLPMVKAVLEAHSCPAAQVASVLDERFAKNQAEGLVQAFFADYPFIRIDEDRYFMAPSPFLRLHAYSGPLFRLLALARESAETRGDSRPWISPESQRLGRRFESTVLQMVRKLYRPEQCVEEYVYDEKGQAKSPDLLVFESEDDLILVQAKLKRLSSEAFYGTDYTAFMADTGGALAETVWKSMRYLHKLDAAALGGRTSPEAEATNVRARRAKRIIFLGLLPALPPVFRAKPYREELEKAVRAALKPEEAEWVDRNSARLVGWHVMDLAELSSFAMLPGACAKGLFTFLASYLGELKQTPFVTDRGFFPAFRDWLILQHGESVGIPAYDRALNAMWEDAQQLMFAGQSAPEVEVRLAAYFRWVERGRPVGDDQADWYAADWKLRRRP